ncbi:hypothetical protein S7335_1216 [Synechococcus sp. PCC 7335]|nr:hypothetical protein S7335_1196 [Synechococcus sp. PCC 7335]EDX82512.1 hypothetical protein S7335_1216 [Synechococcus sp. PCC 7335]
MIGSKSDHTGRKVTALESDHFESRDRSAASLSLTIYIYTHHSVTVLYSKWI